MIEHDIDSPDPLSIIVSRIEDTDEVIEVSKDGWTVAVIIGVDYFNTLMHKAGEM